MLNMKGLIRFIRQSHPGFYLLLTALVTVTALLAGSTPAFATSQLQQDPPRRQLIIFLQGIFTELSSEEANQGNIVGMGQTVPDAVSAVFPGANIDPDASTRLLMYSYKGSTSANGLPQSYKCADTVTSSIINDIRLLDKQIENAFNTQPDGAEVDIYLIGHSLGGAVALAYLDFLQQGLEVSLPPNAHLKAVITLDSPLGGVAPGAFSSFTAFGNEVLRRRCQELDQQDPFTSPSDLVEVFNSTSVTTPEPQEITPRGARASFLVLHRGKLPTPVPSNGDLAEVAKISPPFGLGTSFLSVGNINDFLWNPKACIRALPSFLGTQFLEDEGDVLGIYGREFVSGSSTCPGILDTERAKQIAIDNHGVVLNNQNVRDGIKNFLTPLVGGAVGGTPKPLVINRYQDSSSLK
jgi:pimeloyl-ACP methyl ester carboxylesterase